MSEDSPAKSPPPPPDDGRRRPDAAERVQRWVFGVLQCILVLSIAGAVYERQWLAALTILGIVFLFFVPSMLERRLRVHIPAEFEMLAILFAFATLFLGEVRSYYTRIWWWDIALHTTSGLLLGILGFLLVYILNENDEIDLHMRPGFVAFFAFVFAVAIGGLWEIFEFTMDQVFGAQMQKPMFGDPSGLTDTMWDLIVDTLGAAIISGLGWWHMRRKTHSFIDLWIRKFVETNPRLFQREK